LIIGLTGGYCAGKNAAAAILERRGWTCIDVDKLGHEAMELSKGAIIARFGPGVVGSDGELDRRALARIVFSDPEALADQEAIVHPAAIRLTKERIAEAAEAAARAERESLVCVNAALLHRAEVIDDCDAIIEVRAPLALRLLRGVKRDQASLAEAARRISRQGSFAKELRATAGTVPIFRLDNWRGKEKLERGLARILDRIAKHAYARV
jgi:dephospho-CoA kinase